MSSKKSIRFDMEGKEGYLGNPLRRSKVDLNDLIKRVKQEEKKTKRNNLAISAAALLAVSVFGIILTL